MFGACIMIVSVAMTERAQPGRDNCGVIILTVKYFSLCKGLPQTSSIQNTSHNDMKGQAVGYVYKTWYISIGNLADPMIGH